MRPKDLYIHHILRHDLVQKMERKAAAIIIAATVLAVAVVGALAWMMLPDIEEFEVDGIGYVTAYDQAVVNGYDDRSNDLVIPSEVEHDGKTYRVSAIADEAFKDCLFLTVSIPDSIQYIGECAFLDAMVASVHIPDSVEEIGDGALASRYIRSITLSDDNGDFKMIDGVLFSKDGKRLIAYPAGLPASSYSIPAGTEILDGYSFHHNYMLSEIHIPPSVRSMDSTFIDVKSVSAYHVDPDNTEYSSTDGVLFSKEGKRLITYPVKKEGPSYEIPAGTEILEVDSMSVTQLEYVIFPETLRTIAEGCFSYSYLLREIEWNGSVDSIGDYAFKGCISLESATIPDGVVSLGDNVFEGCDNLRELNIGSGLETLDATMFRECTSLTTITVSSSNGYLVCIDGIVYTKDVKTLHLAPKVLTNTTVIVEDGVTEIGGYSFTGSTAEHVILPDSVETIGEYAFRDSTLKDIVLGNRLESIGLRAFMCCYDMASVEIPPSVRTIGQSAFYGCNSLTGIVFPEGVETIGDYALSNCTSLTGFNIPSTLKEFGMMIGMSVLESVSVSPDSKHYTSMDGIVYTRDMRMLVLCPAEQDKAHVEIADGTETIAPYAFSHCKGLITITVPPSVREVDEGAFYRCSALTSVDLGGIKTVGDEAFNYCTSLSKASFGENLLSIGKNAFLGCSALGSMTFGCKDAPDVGENAFILGDGRNTVSCTVRSNLEPGFLDDASGFVKFDYVKL